MYMLLVQRLKEMDINIIQTSDAGKDFSAVKPEDVVILPAFGASVSEMRMMNEMKVQIVDTTCPWVRAPSHRSVDHPGLTHYDVVHSVLTAPFLGAGSPQP